MSEHEGGAAAEAGLHARIAELARELAEEREAHHASERALVQAIDSEQQRLAQILHDTLSQSLSAARIYARIARDTAERSGPQASAAVLKLEEVIRKAADELEQVTRWLRPARLDVTGLIASLADLCRLAARTMPCEFQCSHSAIDADAEPQAELLRAAQLVLREIARSNKSKALLLIQLELDERHLSLEMRGSWDQPLPSELERLIAIRARALGGSFTAQHEPEGGSTLSWGLPKRR